MPLIEASRKSCCFSAALHPQLAQDAGHVVFDSFLGQKHVLGDFTIGQALTNEFKNPSLLRR